jgi:septal ring factor EnvC (AmiA/AmiB activator)
MKSEISDESEDLQRGSDRSGSPQPVHTLAPSTARSQDTSAHQTTSSASPTPATSRPSKTRNSLPSNPPSAFNKSCIKRVTKKIVKFQTDLEAAEANLSDKRRYLQDSRGRRRRQSKRRSISEILAEIQICRILASWI